MWSFRTYTFYKKPTKFKVRPGSLGHLSLLYYKSFTVSILSNKFIVGIEHVKRLCYSNPRLLEPMPGGGGVHGMRGARGAVGGEARQNSFTDLWTQPYNNTKEPGRKFNLSIGSALHVYCVGTCLYHPPLSSSLCRVMVERLSDWIGTPVVH